MRGRIGMVAKNKTVMALCYIVREGEAGQGALIGASCDGPPR